MTREKLAEIFNETQERFIEEKMTGEKLKEAISNYLDEDGKISPTQMAIFAYLEGFKCSTDFMWEVLTKIVEYEELREEFRKEMFQDVMKEAQEQMKKTGKNPFDF